MGRRLGLGLGLAALGLAAVLFAAWPAADEAPSGKDLRPAPVSPAPIAATPFVPRPAEDGGLEATVRFRLMGPEGPVTEGQAALFLASGPSHHGRAMAAARASPGADGWVTFALVPAADDAPRIAVWAPYFAFHEGPLVDGATVILAPLPVLHGRVLMPDRSPAAGARVGNLDEPWVSTVADGQGAFTLKLPRPGSLIAERDDLSAEAAVPNPEAELELVLRETPKETGTLLQRDGGPIEGVAVVLQRGALQKHYQTAQDGTWSGTFFVGQSNDLTYTKDGYHPLTESQVRFSVRRGPVVLSRPSRIVGTLVTHDGRAVAEEEVTCTAQEAVTTDVDGRFSFDDVAEPTVSLEAYVDDVRTRKDVAVPEGTTVTVKLMAAPALIAVPLEVVDVTGEPNLGWEATATPVPARGWESHASFGDPDGLGLTQGRFRIVVRDEERELSGGTTLDVSPAVDARPIHIVVYGPDGGRGKRLPDDRDPIAKVKIRVVRPEGAPALDATVSCSGGSRSLGGGVFECPFFEDEDGAIEVTAEAGGGSAVAHVSLGDREVTMTVRPARVIRGKVLGPVPPNAYLEINSAAEMDEVPLTTNAFELEGRPAVRTVLCVMQRPTGPEPGDAVRLGCAVVASDDPVEIPLGAPSPVTFTVVDEKGAPVEHPMLYVDRRGDPHDSPKGKTELQLVPGTHVMVINVAGSKARAELVFTVRAGAPTDLGTLKLK